MRVAIALVCHRLMSKASNLGLARMFVSPAVEAIPQCSWLAFATILRMLTRRDFAGLLTTSLASPLLRHPAPAQEAPSPSRTSAPKSSVMMWTLNKLGTFEQNLERVAQAGYTQIELVTEFKAWSDADTSRILNRMHSLGISVDAIAGMKLGFADPAGGDAFLAELQTLIPIVRRFGCGQIILVSGKQVATQNTDQRAACIETLRRAAPMLAQAGLTAAIEPIDRLENPTIYLDSVSEAFGIVKAIDSPAIRVLYDIYHEQRAHGNLIEKFEQNIASVGLIHIADVPGRNQPGTGEINYASIYRKLAELKYAGTVAMEFYPIGDPVEILRNAREQLMRSF
jgi:hydroxypyruvate isomerase